MSKFGEIRNGQLDIWCQQTGRNKENPAHFSGAYECQWQVIGEEAGCDHIHVFCVIGNWASHISDWLIDDRFDAIDFTSPLFDDHERIVRHYQLLHYIVYELFVDFSKIDPSLKNRDFHEFINNNIKHKIDSKNVKISTRNHPMITLGMIPDKCAPIKRVSEKYTFDNETKDIIHYYSLEELITMTLEGYSRINEVIMEDATKDFKREIYHKDLSLN